MSMFNIKNVFASSKTPAKKTPEEIEQEIQSVKQQIKQEQKALEGNIQMIFLCLDFLN